MNVSKVKRRERVERVVVINCMTIVCFVRAMLLKKWKRQNTVRIKSKISHY